MPKSNKVCTVPGCSARRLAHGLCTGHNMRRWQSRPVPGPLQPQRRLSETERREVVQLRKQGVTYKELARLFQCSRSAVARACGYRPPGRSLQDALKSALWKAGLRWTAGTGEGPVLQISPRPVVVLQRERAVVVLDNCFLRGCPEHWHQPEWRYARGLTRLREVTAHDRRQTLALERRGWRVIRVWQHEVTASPEQAARRVRRALAGEAAPSWRIAGVTTVDPLREMEQRSLVDLRDPAALREEAWSPERRSRLG